MLDKRATRNLKIQCSISLKEKRCPPILYDAVVMSFANPEEEGGDPSSA